jgi:hypothetical protein
VLRQWRRDEVFDDGSRLNALRSPLACGDVFRKDESNHYWILLAQPCDLIVRPDGTRKADEGFLVRLTNSYTPAAGSEGHRYFDLPALEGTDLWAVDFRSWVSVSLECLEWTAFNTDGRVALTKATTPPAGLLPGWEKRFDKAQRRHQNGRQFCLSLGSISHKLATASATSVAFPYRRIARLRGSRAAGAYSAFASYHARGAFDHDFAKGAEPVAPVAGAATPPPATS